MVLGDFRVQLSWGYFGSGNWRCRWNINATLEIEAVYSAGRGDVFAWEREGNGGEAFR
jgi:hypothetical protein